MYIYVYISCIHIYHIFIHIWQCTASWSDNRSGRRIYEIIRLDDTQIKLDDCLICLIKSDNAQSNIYIYVYVYTYTYM